jgi:hypothetical protein
MNGVMGGDKGDIYSGTSLRLFKWIKAYRLMIQDFVILITSPAG